MIRIQMKKTNKVCIVSIPYGAYLVFNGDAVFADENIRYVKVPKERGAQ